MLLRKFFEACGVKIKITSDWEGNGVAEQEIVVGDSTRLAEAGLDLHSVGEEGYFACVRGGKLYLAGGSVAATRRAVEQFLTEFFGYAGDVSAGTAVTNVTVPGDYDRSVRQTYPITSYTIDGRDLSEYTIVAANFAKNRQLKAAAERLQSLFYRSTGVWLPIAESGEAGRQIRLEPVAAGKFTASVEKGDLVLRSSLGDATVNEMIRGLSSFAAEYLNGREGAVALDAKLDYSVTVSGYVLYSEFGAVGDGKKDDLSAIIKTHDYANAHYLTVRGDEGATYYIGAHTTTAEIRTDVDWTGCSFIFDDSNQPLDNRSVHVFRVPHESTPVSLSSLGVTKIAKGQTKLELSQPLDGDRYVVLYNDAKKLFIREGSNQNDGTAQTDCFLLHPDGTIDETTPVIWDFDRISSSQVYPIESRQLTIRGGTITTIANQAPSNYTYFTTNILIERSNTHVVGLKHYVTGEGDHGAPYDGIIQVNYCANVTIEDCLFTAHYIYRTIGSAGTSVSMGSYDMRQRSAINVTYRNCTQTTDILDTHYWGVFVSDFCKNLNLERCTFSRFDAHMGVTNATIKGCTLGHQCLNAIGHGLLTIEDSTLYGTNFISLRGDYGSTWNGDVLIKNCTWIPNLGKGVGAANALVSGSFSGQHDFGYDCYMPQHITIDGLHIQDQKHSGGYKGIYLLGNITSSNTSEKFKYKYPYYVTQTITISNFTSDTGYSWQLSPNKYMYRDVIVTEK